MATMPSSEDFDFNNGSEPDDGKGPDEPPAPKPKPIAKVSHGGGRPTMYKTTDGKRVPGVTTILSRFKESGGLIHWAWQLGSEGKDYRKVRDEAADAGHIAHAWIDDTIHGRSLTEYPDADPLTVDKAFESLSAFKEWSSQVGLQIVDTERPLVSEVHRFGGTYDAIGVLAGKAPILLDWKSGNRVYPDHIVQVAAYRALVRECHPAVQGLESACLLRVDKEFASFAYYSFPAQVLDAGWESFKKMRELYELDKTLKRAVGA